jgi:hypothetical protein
MAIYPLNHFDKLSDVTLISPIWLNGMASEPSEEPRPSGKEPTWECLSMCGTPTSSPSLREPQLIDSSTTKAGMVATVLNPPPRMETMAVGALAVFAGNLTRKTIGSAHVSLKKSAASAEMPAFQRGNLLTR